MAGDRSEAATLRAGYTRRLVDLTDARPRTVADVPAHSHLATADKIHSGCKSLSPKKWLRHIEGR